MRNHFYVSAILVIALAMSTLQVAAQTGEFASPVPGSVVHQGYALQDWFQSLRNPPPEQPPMVAPVSAPVEIAPQQPVKPKKVTKSSSVQPKQPQ
jgi:hypothetical protein